MRREKARRVSCKLLEIVVDDGLGMVGAILRPQRSQVWLKSAMLGFSRKYTPPIIIHPLCRAYTACHGGGEKLQAGADSLRRGPMIAKELMKVCTTKATATLAHLR